MGKTKPGSISEYIAAAPEHAREKLMQLHELLESVAPKAKQGIKWGYPVYEENRILFSFAAHKHHINFMPTRTALEPFKKELEKYVTGKDTLQLPYDKPLPKALIKRIAVYRAKDVREHDARWM